MERRKITVEFKLEAKRLIKTNGARMHFFTTFL